MSKDTFRDQLAANAIFIKIFIIVEFLADHAVVVVPKMWLVNG